MGGKHRAFNTHRGARFQKGCWHTGRASTRHGAAPRAAPGSPTSVGDPPYSARPLPTLRFLVRSSGDSLFKKKKAKRIMAIDKLFQKQNTLKGNSNALREYKQTITLNPVQREVLVGTLLGDASIPLRRGKPVLCVKFIQTIARSEYIWHLYEIFSNFVGTPPRVQKTRLGPARDYQSMRFQ